LKRDLTVLEYLQTSSKKEDPLDMLKRRFGNGEIDEEEYEKRKAILEKDGTE